MADINMSSKVRYLVLITVSLVPHVFCGFDEPPKQGLLNEIEEKKENRIRIVLKVAVKFHRHFTIITSNIRLENSI